MTRLRFVVVATAALGGRRGGLSSEGKVRALDAPEEGIVSAYPDVLQRVIAELREYKAVATSSVASFDRPHDP